MKKYKNAEVLKNFMEEFFPFDHFMEIGMFKEEIRNDYQAQAHRICTFFGFECVYEYGAIELRAHFSFHSPDDHWKDSRPKGFEDFVTVIPSIYD